MTTGGFRFLPTSIAARWAGLPPSGCVVPGVRV